MSPESPHAGTEVVRGLNAPELLVRTRRADRTLCGPSTYRVGRDPASDIVVDDSRVSWQHGVLRVDGQAWIFEDVGSTNGTFLGPSRVTRIDIGADCVFKLGNADDGPVLRCIPQGFPQSVPQLPEAITPPMPPKAPRAPMPPPRYAPPPAGAAVGAGAAQAVAALAAPSVDRRPTQRLRLPDKRLTIGRSSESDLCLTDDLEVSRNHAELRRTPTGTFEIVDVGSYNGVYVNGQRVPKSLVTEQDIISIGRSTFRLAGGELRHYVDEGEVTFTAQDLVVKVGGGKILLDHVSFPIPEKCLLGVIGPSGAGKSTLLGALTGMRPADTGTVLYDNRDLYRDYAELRHRIGLVPQESVLHTQLTSRRALLYSAELRFPADTSSHERSARVDECMGELGLSKHAHTRADRLSGGQLKRVNVAQELLTKPSLLFLDEPTSGLDPGLDKSVMEQMRNLAHDGRTIVVVTHSVANLDTCDRLLVLVPGGRIAFYGPPAEGLQYFGLRGWAEVFQAFEEYPDRDWAAEYRASPAHQKYVAAPQAKPAGQRKDNPAQLQAPPPPHPRGAIRQLGTLSRRYLRVIASDRGSLLFMGLLPVVLGILIHFVVSSQGLGGRPRTNANASEALLLLVVCACLTGTASSFRELVKERPIYIRERAAGLSSGAHLFSKLLVLGGINVLQSVVLVVLVMVGKPMPAHGAFLTGNPWVELILGIAVLALASMCLGLLISALVSTSEKATLMLPLMVMIQVVLSGGVISLGSGLNQLSWIVPARWGFAAAASTVNLNIVSPHLPGTYTDPLWTHASGTWLHDMGALIGLAVLFILIAWYQMRRLSPGRRR